MYNAKAKRLDKSSKLGVPLPFRLFRIHPTDPTLVGREVTPVRPLTIIDDGGVVTFKVTGDAERLIQLSTIYATYGLRITQPNGTPITAKHSAGFIDNAGQAVWSGLNVQFGNDTNVDRTKYYGYKAWFASKLSCGQDASDGYKSAVVYEKDTAGAMDAVPGTACANAGLKKRCKYTENGKIVYVRARLESDVFNTEKYLPSM